MNKLLDEIDKEPILDEVMTHGNIIDDSGDYEQYYSDAPGGEYRKIQIIEYNHCKYVCKWKVIIDVHGDTSKELISFYKL